MSRKMHIWFADEDDIAPDVVYVDADAEDDSIPILGPLTLSR